MVVAVTGIDMMGNNSVNGRRRTANILKYFLEDEKPVQSGPIEVVWGIWRRYSEYAPEGVRLVWRNPRGLARPGLEVGCVLQGRDTRSGGYVPRCESVVVPKGAMNQMRRAIQTLSPTTGEHG